MNYLFQQHFAIIHSTLEAKMSNERIAVIFRKQILGPLGSRK